MSTEHNFPPLPELPDQRLPGKNNAEGKQSAAQQESVIPKGWKPTMAKPLPSVQCTTIKRDGNRCGAWSLAGTTVCLRHGASLPNVKKAAEDRKDMARLKLLDISEDAVDKIEYLMNYASQEQIQLAAAKDILDRAGIKGGMDINVTHEHKVSPMDEINQRLADMASNLNNDQEKDFTSAGELDIIKSEVVDEEVADSEDGQTNE